MRIFKPAVGIAALSLSGLLGAAGPAVAGPLVDPSTLQPVPPPGAECRADGLWVICQTALVFEPENEPIPDFNLPCGTGTVYETAVDARSGLRWYRGGKLVKRFVTRDFDGSWSLAPTGAGPTVAVTAHDNWWTEYAVPGDESSESGTHHGNGFTVEAPGFGVIVHVAGLESPDGSLRGDTRFPEDPAVAAELCEALTR